jgi:hypothetical protein
MTIYKRLKDAIEAKLQASTANKIDWYNEQYTNMEAEKATQYPAVYIEMLDPVQWKESGRNYQHGDVVARMHCVVNDVREEPDRAINFAQRVFLSLNGEVLTSAGQQISTELTRTSSNFPKRYGKLKVVLIDFRFEAHDLSAMPVLEDASPVTFNIT